MIYNTVELEFGVLNILKMNSELGSEAHMRFRAM